MDDWFFVLFLLLFPFVYFSFLGAIMYLKVWHCGNIVGTSPVLSLKFEDLFPPPTNTGARAVASVYFIVRNSIFKKKPTKPTPSSAATPKQVAERRRVKALAMLDVKLAEINATSADLNEANPHSPVSTLAV